MQTKSEGSESSSSGWNALTFVHESPRVPCGPTSLGMFVFYSKGRYAEHCGLNEIFLLLMMILAKRWDHVGDSKSSEDKGPGMYKYLCKQGFCVLYRWDLSWCEEWMKPNGVMSCKVSWKGHRGKIALIAGITLTISSVYPHRGQGHTDSALEKKNMPSKEVYGKWLTVYHAPVFLERALERIIEVCWELRDSLSLKGSWLCHLRWTRRAVLH